VPRSTAPDTPRVGRGETRGGRAAHFFGGCAPLPQGHDSSSALVLASPERRARENDVSNMCPFRCVPIDLGIHGAHVLPRTFSIWTADISNSVIMDHVLELRRGHLPLCTQHTRKMFFKTALAVLICLCAVVSLGHSRPSPVPGGSTFTAKHDNAPGGDKTFEVKVDTGSPGALTPTTVKVNGVSVPFTWTPPEGATTIKITITGTAPAAGDDVEVTGSTAGGNGNDYEGTISWT